MPFGSFWIQKKEKQEKTKNERTEEARQDEVTREKPAGEEPKPRPLEEKPSFFSGPQPDLPAGAGSVGYRISVLLVGYSQRTICNFLCSMNMNMNDIAGEAGLAFYTEDHQTMSRMIEAKKRLDGIFYSRQSAAEQPDEEESCKMQRYAFRLSLAGRQSRCVEFEITCVTREQVQQSGPQQFDALWILEEEPHLEQGTGISGVYGLCKESGNEEKPVLFLASQFEHLERFRVLEREVSLSYETKEKLAEYIRTSWEREAGFTEAVCRMIPVQIYGGLEFAGWDERGEGKLEVSKSGFYQRYIPVGCQMPLIYTVEAYVGSGRTDYFHSEDGNVLITRLFQVFHPYCESEALKAERIGGMNREERN